MAQGLPDALQLRHIKYGAKSQPAQQLQVARAMIAAGRVAEALDLYLITGDEAGIAEIQTRATTEGRPVWLVMIQRAERPVSVADWTACGEAAEKAGRLREAYRAFTMAKDESGLARLEETLPGYEMYVPEGK